MSTLKPDAQASKPPRELIADFRAKHPPVSEIEVLAETLDEIERELQNLYLFWHDLTAARSFFSRQFLGYKIRKLEDQRDMVRIDYLDEEGKWQS